MNILATTSAGAWFSIMRDMGEHFAAGGKIGYSQNFSGIFTLEIAAQGRWYVYSFEKYRLFAQIETGADLIFYERKIYPRFDGKTYPVLLAGLALGGRIPLGSWWYLEPTVRGGYPYIWGIGLNFGGKI
jgi:hypothetical protein